MNKICTFLLTAIMLIVQACKQDTEPKVKCYAWISGMNNLNDSTLINNFRDYKQKGIFGLIYQGGHNPNDYRRLGKIAKKLGLEFHAWIPTMIQSDTSKIDTTWYAVSGNGESAWNKPAYVNYYKFLCPNKEQVYNYLKNIYTKIAEVEELNGLHFDYIRFPDVILAEGLWKKYNLIMDKEYPQFDYCYCKKCVEDFKQNTGIDIKAVKDPSKIQEWKQFRCDLITNIVKKLANDIHTKNKKVSAAVFPGPNSIAKKIVRQEWDKWNIDMFFPMNYNDFYLKDTKWIGERCKEAVEATNNSKPIYSGLFICPKPNNKEKEKDPENHGLLPNELADAIRESMNNGAAGVCLFTPDRMTNEHWKAFYKAIRKHYSITKENNI